MTLTKTVREVLENAQSKALATNGPNHLNVVPVSMIKVNQETIWLFDFFMGKTAENVQQEPEIALSAWTGMDGMQIKGKAEYITDGDLFNQAKSWVKTQNPDRVVRGLLVLHPTDTFDISPAHTYATQEAHV